MQPVIDGEVQTLLALKGRQAVKKDEVDRAEKVAAFLEKLTLDGSSSAAAQQVGRNRRACGGGRAIARDALRAAVGSSPCLTAEVQGSGDAVEHPIGAPRLSGDASAPGAGGVGGEGGREGGDEHQGTRGQGQRTRDIHMLPNLLCLTYPVAGRLAGGSEECGRAPGHAQGRVGVEGGGAEAGDG